MCICASIYLFVHLLYMYYMCNFGQRSVCLKTLVLPRGSCPGKFTQKIPFLRYKGLVLHSPEAVYAQNNFSQR